MNGQERFLSINLHGYINDLDLCPRYCSSMPNHRQ